MNTLFLTPEMNALAREVLEFRRSCDENPMPNRKMRIVLTPWDFEVIACETGHWDVKPGQVVGTLYGVEMVAP